MKYHCTLTPEDGAITVEFPDLPNVLTVGQSEVEALFNAHEALNGVLASDLSRGFPLPEPQFKGGHAIEVDADVALYWEKHG